MGEGSIQMHGDNTQKRWQVIVYDYWTLFKIEIKHSISSISVHPCIEYCMFTCIIYRYHYAKSPCELIVSSIVITKLLHLTLITTILMFYILSHRWSLYTKIDSLWKISQDCEAAHICHCKHSITHYNKHNCVQEHITKMNILQPHSLPTTNISTLCLPLLR